MTRIRSIFLLVALALLAAPAALASHQFSDVPDTNQFHNEISIFKQTNITTGCTATTFCPTDYVKRQAMAAFIDRALGLVIRPGETTYKAVPGSLASAIDDDQSFVGTSFNALHLQGPYDNVVGGFSGNSVEAGVDTSAVGATIAGGGSTIYPNRVSDDYGSVGGGIGNRAGDAAGTTNDRPYATVAGGNANTASGHGSAVAGGSLNTASGSYSTVAGGLSNIASSTYSEVAGGVYNTASGEHSLAAGDRAVADDTGAFVWGDGNWFGGDGFNYSPAPYSFSAHATGGFNFWTNQSGGTTGCWIAVGGGTLTCSSDRRVKTNFAPVDRQVLLRKVASLPITSWNYRAQSRAQRHIGPTAQDFAAAFKVGDDTKSISMVDGAGVSLAAIQGLYRQNQALQKRVSSLERQNARLGALAREVAELKRAK